MTSAGPLNVRQPRVSDVPEDAAKYRSKLLRPYKRRSEGLDGLFPRLLIEGLATRDFEPSLRALIGEQAPLSPSSISRLNGQFKAEFDAWKQRPLSSSGIVYIWADGVYLKAGISDEKLCVLVVIGADREGKKHLLALEDGYRESKDSWLNLLRDLKARGMNEPAIAIADGALGFWAGTARGLAADTRATLLAAQDPKHSRQTAETRAHGSGDEDQGPSTWPREKRWRQNWQKS